MSKDFRHVTPQYPHNPDIVYTTSQYVHRSKDGGQTWSPNFSVYESPDGHICECCHPSAVIAADGAIHVMFRNWLGEIGRAHV